MMASGVYAIPKIEANVTAVVTNTTPTGPVRGAGRPEATQMLERVIDMFAAEVSLDPAEVRRRNFIAKDAFPYQTAAGAHYDCGDYATALDRVLERADYGALREEQEARRRSGDPKQLGIGLSTYVEITNGINETEFGAVEITADGMAIVRSGSQSQGQGHETTFAQIAAERLGLPLEKISVIEGDTDAVARGTGTYGSKSTQIGGAAAAEASEAVVERAKRLAADELEANPDDMLLDLEKGRFHVAGAPEPALSWSELAARLEQREALSELRAEIDFTAEQPTFPFGAHLAVVEVDTETGAVTLERIVALDDAGRIINPLVAEGQVHGGLAAGIAQALYEEVTYDEHGNPQNANLVTYGFPGPTELPSFELVEMETPTPVNPLGAKGIGESGTIGATPAVHNAVIDALAPFGVRHIDMPVNGERVWRALQNGRAELDTGTLAAIATIYGGVRPNRSPQPLPRGLPDHTPPMGQSRSSRSATVSMTASGRRAAGTSSRTTLPLMPLRTSTVVAPPMRPSAMSIPRSSPITATSLVFTPRRRLTSPSAARDGLPSTRGPRAGDLRDRGGGHRAAAEDDPVRARVPADIAAGQQRRAGRHRACGTLERGEVDLVDVRDEHGARVLAVGDGDAGGDHPLAHASGREQLHRRGPVPAQQVRRGAVDRREDLVVGDRKSVVAQAARDHAPTARGCRS